jgi:hypothetical protein
MWVWDLCHLLIKYSKPRVCRQCLLVNILALFILCMVSIFRGHWGEKSKDKLWNFYQTIQCMLIDQSSSSCFLIILRQLSSHLVIKLDLEWDTHGAIWVPSGHLHTLQKGALPWSWVNSPPHLHILTSSCTSLETILTSHHLLCTHSSSLGSTPDQCGQHQLSSLIFWPLILEWFGQ